MIAWLQGKIIEKNPPFLVVTTNGVGYLVETSMQTFFKLPEEEQMVTLYIQTIIREDANLLYGFYDKAEREMFQLLIKISGIGPKLALAILSGIDYNELVQCIALKNTLALGKLPGIGKKTAERLVIEMQDKIKHLSYVNATENSNEKEGIAIRGTSSILPFPQSLPSVQDATSALLSLGYKLPQINLAIDSMTLEDNITSEQIIREALKYFSKR